MENFKFYLVTFLLVLGAGFLGYGAIASLRDPVYYVNNQTLDTLGDMKNNAATPEPADVPADPAVTPEPVVATTPEPEKPAEPVSKNAALIAKLEKIPSGTILKNGSTGDYVRSLQEALNTVAGAGLPVNGAFGDKTEAAIRTFQKSAGISPQTGQASDKTFAALIEKLK